MTDEIREKIRDTIISNIENQEQNIKTLEEVTKPIAPDDAIGRLTRMEAINAKSITEASLRTGRRKLIMLKNALSRIDEPDFGICSMCEEPIPAGRLMLMPETRTCVRCADR